MNKSYFIAGAASVGIEENVYVQGRSKKSGDSAYATTVRAAEREGLFALFGGQRDASVAARVLKERDEDVREHPDEGMRAFWQDLTADGEQQNASFAAAVIQNGVLKAYTAGTSYVCYYSEGLLYGLSNARPKKEGETVEELSVGETMRWNPSDILIIFSDGVRAALSDRELLSLIHEYAGDRALASIIVEAARRRGAESASAIVVQSTDKNGQYHVFSEKGSSKKSMRLWWVPLVAFLLLGGICGVLLILMLQHTAPADSPAPAVTTTTVMETAMTTIPYTLPVTTTTAAPEIETEQPAAESMMDPPADATVTDETGEDNRVNLRSAPVIEDETRADTIRVGETIKVFAEQDGWYYIEYNGAHYWISTDYVTLDQQQEQGEQE